MDSPKKNNHSIDFNKLVEKYYSPLFCFARSLAKNEEDASELTQQTFYIWAQKGSSLRDPSKAKSWLFTTLYREFLRLYRHNSRMASYEPSLIDAELPAVNPDIVTALDASSALEALGRVDEIYRVPLTLFYLKDLSYKEIAAMLKLPIGTVMSRLSRGKTQLKKILLKKEPTKSKAVASNTAAHKKKSDG